MSAISGFEGFFGSEEEAAAFIRRYEESTNTHYVIVKCRKAGTLLQVTQIAQLRRPVEFNFTYFNKISLQLINGRWLSYCIHTAHV